MCGIFCFTGRNFSPNLLMDGIRRLEYRGYDSWGIAMARNDHIYIHRTLNRIGSSSLPDFPAEKYKAGISHTRWATHGVPSIENAHPHSNSSKSLAIVHNGIIENYKPLREKLQKMGYMFSSETDSEVLVHLIDYFINDGLELRLAFLEALKSIEGTYGIALIAQDMPGTIFLGRKGSPLVIGKGEGFTVAASDASAIIPHTRSVVYLDDGECAQLTCEGFESYRLDETPTVKEVEKLTFDLAAIELGGYRHFMEKEIHEQPQTICDAMRGRIDKGTGSIRLGGIDDALLKNAKRLKILACGTSWHAGLIGKYMFESLAGIPAEVCYAAEFRYAEPAIEQETLVISISQSGETADTLAGIREAKQRNTRVMGIVNAVGSTIARECGQGVFLHAGPEIGVASTKAFTSQVVVLALLALKASRMRNMSLGEGLVFIDALKKLSEQTEEALKLDSLIQSIALEFAGFNNFLYIGRLYEYPLALEGALKLKEISYIHAEGIPAAELKHGPIALIDKNMPVVVLAAQSKILDKMVANVNEIRARGGRIIAVVSQSGTELENLAEHVIHIPTTLDPLVPVIGAIPLQLLAYHIAVARGCDVDRPRNLAKSVTVE
ncbi:MAG: glutamine--fructose-6-phosphate transaminase (isomerizing) [Candidatus Latescibacteria bacterium]|nr:glutamine--fructose-6-phosphate transaminase (isomerizing) [Candidatus Latescibacterota bacterium]